MPEDLLTSSNWSGRLSAEVVEEEVGGVGEAAWAAHDGGSLPGAAGGFSGGGSFGEVEVDVGGDHQVELAVAVVVDEGAAGAPLIAGAGDAGLLGNFFEGAVSLIVEEAAFAVAGDVEVVEAVIVVVADASSLAPAGGGEAGFGGDVGEGSVVVVVKQMV